MAKCTLYSFNGIGGETVKLLYHAKPAAEKCYFYIMTAKPTLLPSTINSTHYTSFKGRSSNFCASDSCLMLDYLRVVNFRIIIIIIIILVQ